jgi:hypothetical protein
MLVICVLYVCLSLYNVDGLASQVDGLGRLDYISRLRVLGLFSISGILLRSDLVKVWKSFHPMVDVDLLCIFELARDDKTRGHAFKLAVTRCHFERK